MRTWETRFPPSSATAMFMGWPISAAFFSAAAMIRRASLSVTWLIGALLGYVNSFRRYPNNFFPARGDDLDLGGRNRTRGASAAVPGVLWKRFTGRRPFAFLRRKNEIQ